MTDGPSRYRVVALPNDKMGKTPDWVQQAWINVELENCSPPDQNDRPYDIADNLPAGCEIGIKVQYDRAVARLAEQHPQAAAWYRKKKLQMIDGVQHTYHMMYFEPECIVPILDKPPPPDTPINEWQS